MPHTGIRIGRDDIDLQYSPLGICGSGTLRAIAESTKTRSWMSMLCRNVGMFVLLMMPSRRPQFDVAEFLRLAIFDG